MSSSKSAAVQATKVVDLMNRTKRIVSPFNSIYGQPGRHAKSGIYATVFGSYGFLGTHVMGKLGAIGSTVIAPYRGDELDPRHLKTAFDLGNLGLVPFSPRHEDSIRNSMKNSDVVINLIGKYYETKHLVPTRRPDGKISRVNYSFEDTHIHVPQTIARLAKEAGVKCLIHVSALGCNVESHSRWNVSKRLGEDAVRKEFPEAIIVRPANMYGHDDKFLQWFARPQRWSPLFPIIDGGSALVQPVAVQDVSQGILNIVKNYHKYQGETFEFAGPEAFSYRQIVDMVSETTTVMRPLVDVPSIVAYGAGIAGEFMINQPFTRDLLAKYTEDAVMSNDGSCKTLETLGIDPRPLGPNLYDLLYFYRPGGHFVEIEGYH